MKLLSIIFKFFHQCCVFIGMFNIILYILCFLAGGGVVYVADPSGLDDAKAATKHVESLVVVLGGK